MTRGVLLGGLAALLLAGAYWISLQSAVRARDATGNGRNAEVYREPEILLSGVEVREIRKGGRIDRVLARQASYRVVSQSLFAEQVTFAMEDGGGKIMVEAPQVSWNMREGRLDLPEGGTARNGSGWSAQVPDARIDLPGQVLRANRATLSIPGIRVDGSGLVWRWKEGTVELASPESRVHPDPLRRGTGKMGGA